jgi:TPR repeat protein
MNAYTKAACLALALCFATTQTADAKENKQSGRPSKDSGTNVCPPKKPAYKATLDERLDQMDLEGLTVLADQGRAEAMVVLGLRYTGEKPVGGEGSLPAVEPNLEKAIALFQRAADKGNPEGEYLMGTAYLGGLGVPKDESRALSWFKRAAKHGNVPAQFWTGEMIAKGRGGATADWKAALPYFKKAADGGSADGYFEMGFMYSDGLGGLEQNDEKAAYCYRQSVQLGSQMAQYNLRLLINDGKIAWEPGDPGDPLTPNTTGK